jgi:GxxExxY protein
MGHEFEAISGQVIEAAIAVHKELGPGFLESIYQNAMVVALRNRGIPYEDQREIEIVFEGVVVGKHRLDLVVPEQIVIELKAVRELDEVHFAQVRSYLKASGLHVGLLLNFNATTLVIKRVVL